MLSPVRIKGSKKKESLTLAQGGTIITNENVLNPHICCWKCSACLCPVDTQPHPQPLYNSFYHLSKPSPTSSIRHVISSPSNLFDAQCQEVSLWSTKSSGILWFGLATKSPLDWLTDLEIDPPSMRSPGEKGRNYMQDIRRRTRCNITRKVWNKNLCVVSHFAYVLRIRV